MTQLKSILLALGLALSGLFTAGAAAPSEAHACSCIPPHLPSIYNQADETLRVWVIHQLQIGQQLRYSAVVIRDFKGCKKFGQIIRLTTHVSSATCGQPLQVGGHYLITGWNQGPGVIGFNLCGYNRAWSQLTAQDIEFLRGRMICCKGSCTCMNGSKPVACFADPCQVQSCPGAASCQANYCGGCFAEFFDEWGSAACWPCDSNADCPFWQQCSPEGQCVKGCQSDADCANTEWCRPTETPGLSECVPYQTEGQWCGGFTPIWWQQKCAPGLVCTDFPPFVADAPGKCRKPCASQSDCPKSQYCALDGVCRDDGACWTAGDCMAPGNLWPHPACEGYATCENQQCGWECGEYDMCTDLADQWFGPCLMILGYGVVNGECQGISGCDAKGIPLFDSFDKCKETCGEPDPCKDLTGIDFGPCDAVLGWGVENGQCVLISGCNAGPYTLFSSAEECKKTCGQSALKWHSTCGDPVCSGWKPKSVPLCKGQTEGAPCNAPGAMCDPQNFCNSLLLCTDKDPTTQPGGCPKSRASLKTDINYLNDEGREKLAAELQQFKLATWRYKSQQPEAPVRLGFMIDDVEPSAAVDAERDMVDLYGYLSMTVAALQVQTQQIEALKAEVETLKAELARRPASRRK